MSPEILKEWVSKLSFVVDAESHRKFIRGLETAAITITAAAASVEAAAVSMFAAVVKVSSGLETLRYSASRTNSSVGSLKSFGFAVSQLGGSFDGALQSVEGLSRKLRESPGYEQMLRNYGVATREQNGQMRDGVKILTDIGKVLSKRPLPEQYAIINALGLDELTVRAIQSGEFDSFFARYREKLRKAGLSPDEAAENSQKLMRAWRDLQASVMIILDKIVGKVAELMGGDLTTFTDWLDEHSSEIADKILEVAKAILTLARYIIDTAIPTFESYLPTLRELWTDVENVAKRIDHAVKSTIGWENAAKAFLAFIVFTWAVRIGVALGRLTTIATALMANPAVVGALAIIAGASAESTPGEGVSSDPVKRQQQAEENKRLTDEANKSQGYTGNLGEDIKRYWKKKAPTWLGGEKTSDTGPVQTPSGIRGVENLKGVNKELVQDLMKASEETGIKFSVSEGLRTQEDANRNAARGVGVRNSKHLIGQAADITMLDAQGNKTWDRGTYQKFADAYERISKSHGGSGRWLGNVPGRWSRDIFHFDQGLGRSHPRDPWDPDAKPATPPPTPKPTKPERKPTNDPAENFRRYMEDPITDEDRRKQSWNRPLGEAGYSKPASSYSFSQDVKVNVGGGDRGPATKSFDLAGPRDNADLLRNTKGPTH